VAAAQAAIAAAETEAIGARAAVAAAAASIERIAADIDDRQLKAPRDSRVQFKVSQPGEVPRRSQGSSRSVPRRGSCSTLLRTG
jgi:HlyD family secretion protein